MFDTIRTMRAAVFLDTKRLALSEAVHTPVPAQISNPTAVPAACDERPVDRCPRCRLVQYRAALNRCRRCYLSLAVAVVAPPPEPRAPTRPDVAAGVRCWRRIRGLTQKQLAVGACLPRTYVSRIENGRIIPGLVTLGRVADALRVALPVLLAPVPPNGRSSGNGNGENLAQGNGNGNRPSFTTPPVNGGAVPSLAVNAEDCFQEILQSSGLLSGPQRMQVLLHVRQLAAPRLAH